MNRRKMMGLLGSACAVALAPGLAGCYGPAYYGGPARAPYYDEYYYYPDIDVYFQIYTGWYYYKSNGIWWHTRHLPPQYHLDSWYRRPLVLKTPPSRRPPPPRKSYPPPPANRPPASMRNRDERQHNERVHEEYLLRWKRK